MKYMFAFIVALHGAIHLMGFAKAFRYANFEALTREISRPLGVFWLVAGILLAAAALHFLTRNEYWWVTGTAAVILSQVMIATSWHDAKLGTAINVLIALVMLVGWASWHYERRYKEDVKSKLAAETPNTLLTEASISHLPDPVKRYIRYSGSLNKPMVHNWKITFKGQIRKDEKSAWMPFTTEQYNFLEKPTRLFFMKARMFGLPVSGYHAYVDGKAVMDIRLLALFTVQYQAGPEMDKAETVTWFNDLCLFAPAALVDPRISWRSADGSSVTAIFTHKNISISARLFFNEKGELINFISDDRYFTDENKKLREVRFSTPAREYVEISGHRVPSYGEAVWNFENNHLTYGQFTLTDIHFNVMN